MKRMLFVALYLISLNLDAVIAKDAPTEGQLPKVLNCGHTVCLGCVAEMVKGRGGRSDSVECATCRQPTRRRAAR